MSMRWCTNKMYGYVFIDVLFCKLEENPSNVRIGMLQIETETAPVPIERYMPYYAKGSVSVTRKKCDVTLFSRRKFLSKSERIEVLDCLTSFDMLAKFLLRHNSYNLVFV